MQLGQGRDGTGTSVGTGGWESSIAWDSRCVQLSQPSRGRQASSSHVALSTGWCWERLGQSSAPQLWLSRGVRLQPQSQACPDLSSLLYLHQASTPSLSPVH